MKRIFFRFLIPLFVFFLGVIFLLNSHFLSIKNIEIVGNKNVITRDIKNGMESILSDRYFGLYNKNNFLFYPEDDLEKNILSNQKIKSVDISYKDFKGNLLVEVIEKVPKFLYCIKNDICFFMEGDGKIFTEFNEHETEIKKEDFFVFWEGAAIGTENFLEEKDFLRVYNLVLEMESIDLKVSSLEKREFNELVMHMSNETKIIFSLHQDFLKIIESVKKISSKKSLKINKEDKDFSSDVVYINMSYGENIFYCLVGEGCEENY